MKMMLNHKTACVCFALVTNLVVSLTVSTAMAQKVGIEHLTFGPQKEKSGKILDSVVAIVGNDVITRKELEKLAGKADRKRQNAVLESLIMEKLLLQQAKNSHIVIGDTSLNIALDEQKRSRRPRSRETLRKQMMIQKLQQRVVNSLVSISEREVADAVAERLKTVDESVHLIDVLVRVPETADATILQQARNKTQKLLRELRALPKTTTTETTAAEKTAIKGYSNVSFNDLGWVPLSQIPATFSQVLIQAPLHRYLEPIVDRDGMHLLKVIARKEGTALAKKAKRQAKGIPQTRVAHILIKGSDTKAKATIDTIYQKLKQGANFADLAKQYSQDLGSATQGGELGWAVPGQMVADFEAVMNKTPIGQMSQPFKSQFGYHILVVHERRQAQGKQRNALEQEVRREIFSKRAAEEWELWLSRLRDEAYVDIRL